MTEYLAKFRKLKVINITIATVLTRIMISLNMKEFIKVSLGLNE
jgi:hypothetical protein